MGGASFFYMKKIIPTLLLFFATLTAQAQSEAALQFGYFSFKEVMEATPDYAAAQQELDKLAAQYEAETKRSEEEFNKKYEEFLDGQNGFAPSILKKRQAELQDLMEKNVAFKKETQRLLKQAKNDAFEPIKQKINAAAKQIGQEKKLLFIINTDNNGMPYADETAGLDITSDLKEQLSK